MGDGSVFKRGDGRWCAKYQDARGKTRYLYRKTKAEVKQALREALGERDKGIATDDGGLTFGAFLDTWLEDIQDIMSYRSWLNQECFVRLHVKPHIGSVRLSKLTRNHLREFYKVKAQELSSGRLRKVQRMVRRALDEAVFQELVSRNVATTIKLSRDYAGEMEILSREQVKTLLEASRGDRLELVYVLAATCGLRQGEILALRHSDFDMGRGTVTIRHTVWRNQIYPPKTPASRRTIKLPKIALEAIQRHDMEQDGFLFTTRNGTPVDPTNFIQRQWKRMLRKAGLPEITKFHSLRHGAVSLLLNQNVPIPVVAKYCGHASPAITMQVYAHMIDGMGGMAADGMDDALG